MQVRTENAWPGFQGLALDTASSTCVQRSEERLLLVAEVEGEICSKRTCSISREPEISCRLRPWTWMRVRVLIDCPAFCKTDELFFQVIATNSIYMVNMLGTDHGLLHWVVGASREIVCPILQSFSALPSPLPDRLPVCPNSHNSKHAFGKRYRWEGKYYDRTYPMSYILKS